MFRLALYADLAAIALFLVLTPASTVLTVKYGWGGYPTRYVEFNRGLLIHSENGVLYNFDTRPWPRNFLERGWTFESNWPPSLALQHDSLPPAVSRMGQTTSIPIPIAAVLLAGAAFPLHRLSRHPKGYCPRCGYDLAGLNSPICPECGTSP